MLADGDLLSESLRGPIGVSTAVTVSALLAMTAFAGVAQRRWSLAWGAAVAGAVALAGFAIEGHTRSQDPIAAMVALDVVHLAAGAVWLGGIAGLVVLFGRHRDRCARPSGRALQHRRRGCRGGGRRGGVGDGRHRAAGARRPVTTGYGLALLTKVALVIPVIVLGAYNRRRLVPMMSAGAAAARRGASAGSCSSSWRSCWSSSA